MDRVLLNKVEIIERDVNQGVYNHYNKTRYRLQHIIGKVKTNMPLSDGEISTVNFYSR